MPVRPDPADPDWRLLTAADGTPLGRFLRDERDGRPLADLFALTAPLDDAVPAILAELRGWRIAGEAELGRALMAAGGRFVRHAHVYTHDLAELPAGRGAGEPLAHTAEQLAPAFRAAFGPDHPEAAMHAADPRGELQALLDRERLDASGAIVRDGEVVAAIFVCPVPGEPPLAGPWVMMLFRHPAHPGTGRALLERAMHRAAQQGLPGLGLAVTEGNRAVGLYEALGFRRVLSGLSVDL